MEEKIEALNAIASGSTEQHYFDIIGDDWDIESKIESALDYWGISDVKPDTPLRELSGGEQTKVFLAAIILKKPRFILLDEPTNHLDSASRDKLYKWIKDTSATLLIVSHDRYLLNLLTDIYELSGDKVSYYPGNYDNYVKQKKAEQDALVRQIDSQKQELKKAKRKQQEVAEARQRQESRGSAKTAKKALPRIIANAKKGLAENTTAELADTHNKKISDLHESIGKLQENIDQNKHLKVQIENSLLHRGKTLIEATELNYAYGKESVWKEGISFTISSGERILIKGGNGTGKTTLIKLVTKGLKPTKGTLQLAAFDYMYLDQQYSIIDQRKSVYEQAQSFNIDMPEHEVKMHLARSLFPADSWNKPCAALSGGEKMKLSLCSLIISAKVPDMLILDEPTNNLDIDSMSVLSSTIQEYSGTLLLISHDRYFVEEVGIERVIDLDE